MAAGADTLHTNARALQLDEATLRSRRVGRNSHQYRRRRSWPGGAGLNHAETCDQQASWKEYAFTARADGALLLNGHDLEVIPKGMSLTTSSLGDRVRTMVAHDPSCIEVRYSPVAHAHHTADVATATVPGLCGALIHLATHLNTFPVTAGFCRVWMSAAYSASAPSRLNAAPKKATRCHKLESVWPGRLVWELAGLGVQASRTRSKSPKSSSL
jgi:hypothetical protein